jgi:hypothetical protein
VSAIAVDDNANSAATAFPRGLGGCHEVPEGLASFVRAGAVQVAGARLMVEKARGVAGRKRPAASVFVVWLLL